MNGRRENTSKNLQRLKIGRKRPLSVKCKSRSNVPTHLVRDTNIAKRFLLFPLYILLILSAIYILVSCSGADPVIYQYQWRIQAYWRYPFASNERLLLQVLVDDDDGFDDIYEMYVIHDESEKYWRITKDEWSLIGVDGVQWIGINNIVSEDYTNLPRGSYRLMVLDYSGYRNERSFDLTAEDQVHSHQSYPILSRQADGTYIPVYTATGNGDKSPTIIMQLVYPEIGVDVAGNTDYSTYNAMSPLLGTDGALFSVKIGKPIRFAVDTVLQYSVYLHMESPGKVLFSSGPYKIDLTLFKNIPKENGGQ